MDHNPLPPEPDVELAPAPAEPSRSLWHALLPLLFFVTLVAGLVYAAPWLVHQWRKMEVESEAEAAYQKRRAELRAENEAADSRLQFLDKKINFVSLGFREVVRKVGPSVVSVQHLSEPKAKEGEFLLNTVLDVEQNRRYQQTGMGSGLIVKKGYLLTNQHVVHGAKRIRILFASGQAVGVDPDAVTSDPMTDLAVIKLPEKLPKGIDQDMLLPAEFADSDKDVQVGDWALAVGSPLGLKQTVSQGIISAKGRFLSRPLIDLLQTDAAIHPGNSGGPLFDQMGRVVGINVAIATENGRNQGIGFAIPSNTARKVFEKLVAGGEVPRGYLGVALDDLPAKELKALALEDAGAVVITRVEPDQPAAQAGLKIGDVLLRFNDTPLSLVQPVHHLRQLIADIEPGQTAAIEIFRNGGRQTVQVVAGKRPASLP